MSGISTSRLARHACFPTARCHAGEFRCSTRRPGTVTPVGPLAALHDDWCVRDDHRSCRVVADPIIRRDSRAKKAEGLRGAWLHLAAAPRHLSSFSPSANSISRRVGSSSLGINVGNNLTPTLVTQRAVRQSLIDASIHLWTPARPGSTC